MKTRYTIKNFRVFDEKGATIDVNPITILTGCNSSGKSSIVKSMVLLNTYIDSIQKDYNVFKEISIGLFQYAILICQAKFLIMNIHKIVH